MTRMVLTVKVEPSYDDLPEERYHFPRTYLAQIERAVGDWAVYYEPRRSTAAASSRGGRQSYFAVARITSIVADPANSDRFYALVADYLEFDHPISFREGGTYFESMLLRDDGGTNKGAFGRAVRAISDGEFEQILRRGFEGALTDGAFAVPPVLPAGRVALRLISSDSTQDARPDWNDSWRVRFVMRRFVPRYARHTTSGAQSLASNSSTVVVDRRFRRLTFGRLHMVGPIPSGMGLPCQARCIGCSIAGCCRSATISG